jgi:hypothetical protein
MTSSALSPLERAIIALLRPLVRLVLKRGVAFGQFAELTKQAYVEVARRDFGVPGRKLSVSRVAARWWGSITSRKKTVMMNDRKTPLRVALALLLGLSWRAGLSCAGGSDNGA